MPESSFSADIAAIRDRARQKMEDGPVTGSYGKDPEKVISVLTLAGDEEHADDLLDLLGA